MFTVFQYVLAPVSWREGVWRGLEYTSQASGQMVREVKQGERMLYICDACGMAYEEREWAGKCQKWCQEYQSCNIEIIAHAVPPESEEK